MKFLFNFKSKKSHLLSVSNKEEDGFLKNFPPLLKGLVPFLRSITVFPAHPESYKFFTKGSYLNLGLGRICFGSDSRK